MYTEEQQFIRRLWFVMDTMPVSKCCVMSMAKVTNPQYRDGVGGGERRCCTIHALYWPSNGHGLVPISALHSPPKFVHPNLLEGRALLWCTSLEVKGKGGGMWLWVKRRKLDTSDKKSQKSKFNEGESINCSLYLSGAIRVSWVATGMALERHRS
jgi:hypothetical protein